jgi:hypothetical protein
MNALHEIVGIALSTAGCDRGEIEMRPVDDPFNFVVKVPEPYRRRAEIALNQLATEVEPLTFTVSLLDHPFEYKKNHYSVKLVLPEELRPFAPIFEKICKDFLT